MNFISPSFLWVFLPLVLLGYHLLPRRGRNLFLLSASWAFYGWWRVDLLGLVLFSTVVDYGCGRAMAKRELRSERRPYLLLSLVVNLGLLAWFKYATLLADTVAALVGSEEELGLPDVVLPLGISFYTFQTLSYSIDVYRGQPATRSFVDFACYVAMFPQLVAGPIVRFEELRDQLRSPRRAAWSEGAQRFLIGFTKKVLIADSAAELVDPVFAMDAPGLLDAWVGVGAFAVQIYFDFSGYSDMAIGLGLLLGFRLPENFASPYRSRSLGEFWHHWHMSLSRWLRDYLYIPMGGNRLSRSRTAHNLAVTMLLGGLWHGAAWTFVLWGAWHGGWLMFERAIGRRPIWATCPRPLQLAFTLLVVCIGWAIFRAEDAGGLLAILVGLSGVGGWGVFPELPAGSLAVPAVLLGAGLALFTRPAQDLVQRPTPLLLLALPIGFLMALALVAERSFRPFLYFQF